MNSGGGKASFSGDGEREADGEFRHAGVGLDIDAAFELLGDDAMDNVEAETGAGAERLRGEEGFEDVGEYFRWDAGSMIGDADGEPAGA